jgi:hypothetical protein
MEQHSLIRFADPDERRNVIGRQAFEISQDDDLTLVRRQLREKLLDASGEAFGHDPVVSAICPRLRWCHPRT